MKKNLIHLKTIFLFLSFALVLGCAHRAAQQDLDEKLASEEPVKNTQQIRNESTNLIQNSTDLAPTQKQALLELQNDARSKIDFYRDQDRRLRSLLMKDLLAEDFNANEIDLIKDRMKLNDRKRLAVLFESVEKANEIMGRPSPNHTEIMRTFFDLHDRQGFQ